MVIYSAVKEIGNLMTHIIKMPLANVFACKLTCIQFSYKAEGA